MKYYFCGSSSLATNQCREVSYDDLFTLETYKIVDNSTKIIAMLIGLGVFFLAVAGISLFFSKGSK